MNHTKQTNSDQKEKPSEKTVSAEAKAETRASELTDVLEHMTETQVTDEKKEETKGEKVTMLDEINFLVGDRQYVLVENHRDAFQPDKFGQRYSDVLNRYDYIVGDWGFEQLRLKGFFRESNRKVPIEQRITTLADYLYEYCNFGCAYFVVERLGNKKDKTQTRSKKQKRNYHKNPKNQAHIDEKKAPVTSNQKPKPIIKSRKNQDNFKNDGTRSSGAKNQQSKREGFKKENFKKNEHKTAPVIAEKTAKSSDRHFTIRKKNES